MANMIDLLIKSTFIVVLGLVNTSVAGIISPDTLIANIEQSQNAYLSDDSNYLVRTKRGAYYNPSEYYANYYNDYYNNYYNRPSQGYYSNIKPSRPLSSSADRFDGNSNYFDRDDSDSDNNIISSGGTKYVYTPIFKYKSTQQKRHKLFVPKNGVIFG